MLAPLPACRDAGPADVPALAILWHDGWQDAHAGLLPEAIGSARTLASFHQRLAEGLGAVRIVEDQDGPVGLSLIKGAELYQFYVAERARGSGAAQLLMADTDARFRDAGVRLAWLACAVGNERAASFYRKTGWRFARNFINVLELPDGPFDLEVWRFEKAFEP